MGPARHKDEVLSAFQKVSLSGVEVEDPRTFQDYIEKHNNLFRYRLHFPQELFKDKAVIDFGCGTGEVDLILASWGTNVLVFDFNQHSIDRALGLRDTFDFGTRLKFTVGDVDNLAISDAA